MTGISLAREGLPFILPPLVLSLIALGLGWHIAAGILFVFTLFLAWFFRNPLRKVIQNDSIVLSPADGTVLGTVEVGAPYDRRVDIFMSVLNVHVNRAPVTGKITRVAYRKGRKLPAGTDEASTSNEHNLVELETENGPVAFKQIAGILARRIVFYPTAGETIQQGNTVGIIKFGSRVEVFLPEGVDIKVRKGDKVRAGKTILALWP